MRYLIFLIICVNYLNFQAQSQTSLLKDYLDTHKYNLEVQPDGSLISADGKLPTRMNELIKSKPIIVYGEGFSHNLHTNGYMEAMFLEYLTKHNLKYHFSESARSWVVVDNLFYNSEISAKDFYPDYKPGTQDLMEVLRKAYRKEHFELRAMDFERRSGFRMAIDTIVHRLEVDKREQLFQLASYIRDTAYMVQSPGKFVKFYEEQQGRFYKDSLSYKGTLGNLYPGFRYLLSDPQPSQYTDNRNRNMANHIIEQIGKPHEGTTYFISCGSAHAQRGKKDGLQKTLVAHLEDNEDFKGKILIVNLYCENCTPDPTQYGIGDNSKLGFMKDEMLQSMQQAGGAKAITLFDLTELPEAYKDIVEDYGDMLVFAKGVR